VMMLARKIIAPPTATPEYLMMRMSLFREARYRVDLRKKRGRVGSVPRAVVDDPASADPGRENDCSPSATPSVRYTLGAHPSPAAPRNRARI
jgi:hypothetical protein